MNPLSFKSRDFVHLHLHTDYSLLQSTIQLKPLAKRLGELEMQACAVTDYGNMYGAVSFYNSMRSAGIRPIIGYEAFVAGGTRFDRTSAVQSGEKPYYNLVLLAKDLSRLSQSCLLIVQSIYGRFSPQSADRSGHFGGP